MPLAVRMLALCCSLIISSSLNAAEDQSSLYIGVLEDIDIPGPVMVSSKIHVRVAFKKRNTDWIPMNTLVPSQSGLQINESFPEKIDWTIVFNGKNLGRIESKNPESLKGYGDIDTQMITSDVRDIPKIQSGVNDFGYTGYKVHSRPLLLVSAPNYSDPDNWKPTKLSISEIADAVKAFRSRVPKMERCVQPEENPVTMIDYPDNYIKVVKAYRSNKGELVFGMQLDYAKDTCQWFDDEIYYDYWFALAKDNVIHFLDIGMTPMEAADLDNSGSADWIFKTFRGEDEDGYDLFYSDFTKKAYYSWTWH